MKRLDRKDPFGQKTRESMSVYLFFRVLDYFVSRGVSQLESTMKQKYMSVTISTEFIVIELVCRR